MKLTRKTYTSYSIGTALVWAVILSIVNAKASKIKRDSINQFFGGWASGWLSATIARSLYPPPKSRAD